MKRAFPYQITDNLFVLGDDLFLTYLLRAESCTLLDLGSSGSAPLIEEQLRKLGIAKAEVEHLVVQHAHWDHVCGLPYFRQLFPKATVVGSAKAREVLGKPKIVEQFRENDERWCTRLKDLGVFAELPAFLRYDSMAVDRIVEDEQTVDLGGIPVRFLATPGHSPCSLSVHLPTEGALLVSDAVGFYLPDVDGFLPMFFQGVDQTLASIDRVADIDTNILGYGHALGLLLEGRAAIAHGMRRLREETVALATRVRGMAAEGRPEAALLEEIHQASYRDFLARLYLPDYLRGVSPFLLKAILRAESLPAA
ncbi:MAG: MBL fold metallo-hydrolase [Proteobacteria bacterium]|nr:MBL fold metallo-hydrolase [Pseudomonadota bacterium]